MRDKTLKIDGLHSDDQDWTFDALYNGGQSVNLVVSEDAPYGLQDAVRGLKVGWETLITEGATELLNRWKSNPDTDVKGATAKLHHLVQLNNFGMSVHHMADAYDIESDGIYAGGSKVAVLLQHHIYLDEYDDELENICGDLGLDYGDFACLCAAYAAKKRGASLFNNEIQERIDRTEAYLRRKVWLIRTLARASAKPLPKSVIEQATEILEGVA